MAAALVVACVAAAEPPLRRSEAVGPPPTAAEAWRQPGMRLSLRLGPELLRGLGRPPPPAAVGAALAFAPALRLTPRWSLGLNLHYVRLLDLAAGGLSGLRYSVTLAPVLHLGPFAVAAGGGLSGIIGTWQPPASGPAFVPASGSCDGTGGHAQVQLSYHLAVGEVFSTGPLLQGELQGTRCSAGPTWWHASSALMWDVAWR